MAKVTQNYSMFRFRPDNRPLTPSHVQKLIASIKYKNMLEFRPIIIDADGYVIDGQHRLEAARQLSVPIYYDIVKECKKEDMIALNVAQSWGLVDYFNFYVQNKFPEYVKMENFCKKHALPTKTGLFIVVSRTKGMIDEFKKGEFKFKEESNEPIVEKCIDAIGVIKKYIGVTKMSVISKKLWRSMFKMCSDAAFDPEIWKRNVGMLSDKISSKATEKDTFEHLLWIHNYRNQNKITLGDDED